MLLFLYYEKQKLEVILRKEMGKRRICRIPAKNDWARRGQMNKMKKLGIVTLLLIISFSYTKMSYASKSYSYGTYGNNQSWIYEQTSNTIYVSCDEKDKEEINFNEKQLPWSQYMDEIKQVRVIVNYLGNNMFNGCRNLEEIYFNRKVNAISDSAFSNCPNLKKIITDVDCKMIKDFANKHGYEYIVIPSNEMVTNIIKGKVIYQIKENCASAIGTTSKKIKSVTIKNTITLNGKKYKVTNIREKAFKNCKKLKKITIQASSISKISKGAFKNCNHLKYIIIKEKCAEKYKKLFRKAGYKNKLKTK